MMTGQFYHTAVCKETACITFDAANSVLDTCSILHLYDVLLDFVHVYKCGVISFSHARVIHHSTASSSTAPDDAHPMQSKRTHEYRQ